LKRARSHACVLSPSLLSLTLAVPTVQVADVPTSRRLGSVGGPSWMETPGQPAGAGAGGSSIDGRRVKEKKKKME